MILRFSNPAVHSVLLLTNIDVSYHGEKGFDKMFLICSYYQIFFSLFIIQTRLILPK